MWRGGKALEVRPPWGKGKTVNQGQNKGRGKGSKGKGKGGKDPDQPSRPRGTGTPCGTDQPRGSILAEFLGDLEPDEAEFLLMLAYPVMTHPPGGRNPTREGDGVFPYKEDLWPRGGRYSHNEFFYEDNIWWPPHSENQYDTTPENFDVPHTRRCLYKLAHDNGLDTGVYYAPLKGEEEGDKGIPPEWKMTNRDAGCCYSTCITHRHRKTWSTAEIYRMAQHILWRYWSTELWEHFPQVVPRLEQIREKALIAAQVAEIPRHLQDDVEDFDEPEQ